MESLDKEWILHGNTQNCEQFEKTPNTLGLKNMAGVFILVGAGIIGGICLIIIEVVYKKHQIKKQKRIELARHAADKWRGTIEVSYFTINRVVISAYAFALVLCGNSIFVFPLKKRKTLRASLAMQRQYNVGIGGGICASSPGTISFAVDNSRYPRIVQSRGPEKAWPGDAEAIRNRRTDNDNNRLFRPLPPPRYTSAYTSNVSHLVV